MDGRDDAVSSISTSSMQHSLPECLTQLPPGWRTVSPEDSAALARELATELCSGHLLQGVDVKVVADTDGITDDILCWHVDEPRRFTVVHLTWRGAQEPVAGHPWIEVDGDFAAFLAYFQTTYPTA